MRKKESNGKRAFITWLLIPSLFISGCWDRKEINDVAFVLASGYDLAGKNLYRNSLLIAIPGQMGGATGGGGGTGGGERPYYTDVETGIDVREASWKMQRRTARVLNFSHRRVVVFGEELARNGIRPVFDIFGRDVQNRLSMYAVISEGKAEDLLNASPHLERFSSDAIREILLFTALYRMKLKEIAQDLAIQGIDPIIPLFKTHEVQSRKEIQAVGYALFRGDKMVGTAKQEEVRGVLLASGKFEPYHQPLHLDGKSVSLLVNKAKRRVTVERTSSPLRFRIRIKAQGRIMESLSNRNYLIEEEIRRLENVWRKTMEKQLEQTVTRLQQLRCDAIGSGQLLNRTYPELWKKYANRWHEEFARAEFVVEASVKIARTGKITQNITIQEEKR